MSGNQGDEAGRPAASTAGAPVGKKKRGPLMSGRKRQYEHVKHLKAYCEEFKAAHKGCRMFMALQSAHSTDILIFTENNMEGWGPKMKDMFTSACTQAAGRSVATLLREDLLELANNNEALIAKLTDRIVELFIAEGLVGPKLRDMMLNCVAGGDGLGSGEHSSMG
jgi:hypothetical protein